MPQTIIRFLPCLSFLRRTDLFPLKCNSARCPAIRSTWHYLPFPHGSARLPGLGKKFLDDGGNDPSVGKSGKTFGRDTHNLAHVRRLACPDFRNDFH